ncbi:MAG: Com family DNA-binding transcriptional regulator [Desulfovibrio sp.]|nr:Com family DNA-binding transcriptional regulator [Desulfovibrio sp.]
MREKEAPQIRCGHCNKLLGKGTALDLAIKCPRCGYINHINHMKAIELHKEKLCGNATKELPPAADQPVPAPGR